MGWSLNDTVRSSPMVNWLPHLLEVRAGHEEHVPLGRYSSGRNLGREGNIFRFVARILNEMLHLYTFIVLRVICKYDIITLA